MHDTVTKADLVEEVIRATDLPRKESEAIVETIFDSIIQALQTGDKIEIRGFGSFRTRQRRGRIGRNPKTGAKVEVPPKRIPFFKPSKELKDFVNGQRPPTAAARCRPKRPLSRSSCHGLSLDALAVSLLPRREGRCVFCDAPAANDDARTFIVLRAKSNFVILNRYPYTSGHVMVVPYAHQATLGLRSRKPRGDDGARAASRAALETLYHPDGYNLGMNVGRAAGAGIAGHLHLHVLPRWIGDTNFMTTVGETRVEPEELTTTYRAIARRLNS